MVLKGIVVLLCACAAAIGCGGGDGEGDSAEGGDGTPSSTTPSGDGDFCARGCVMTVAADCPIGPESQESCEADCESFAEGQCADSYDAFQACADGREVSCGLIGIPVVPGCETEQDAFITCQTQN